MMLNTMGTRPGIAVPVAHPRGRAVVTQLWVSTVYIQMVVIWSWLSPTVANPGVFHPETEPTEYCEAENFDPTCQPGQVIVMMTALYGRIALGRCAKVSYGYLGCYQDVMDVMDAKCSGRNACDVRIPNHELDSKYTCTGEFKTYLNASYACVQVETAACESCNARGHAPKQARLQLQRGFISSWVTVAKDGCGSTPCPWVIEVPPGQKVNLTLYDFSDRTQSNPAHNAWGAPCSRFGVIKEESAPKDTAICKGVARESHLFLSLSNKVEIHVVSPEVLKNSGHFLLYYEAVGCADYDPPDNTKLQRQDDRITVSCLNSEESWELNCVGNQWQGSVGRCPAPPPPQVGGMSLPLGVLIAIVVGIALVIGVLILTIGIVCLKRQQHDLHQVPETTLYVRARQEPEYREEIADPRLYPKYETTPLTSSQKPPIRVVLPPPQIRGTAAHGGPRENLYFRRMEQRPLPSLPNLEEQPLQAQGPARERTPSTKGYSDDDPNKYRVQVHRTGSGREQHHSQYPPPPRAVTKRAHSTGSSSRDDPQYFVLDPDDHLPENPESEDCATASASASSASASASAAPRPVRKRTPSGPAGQTCASTSLQDDDSPVRGASCVASTHHSGSGRIEGNSSNNQPPRLSKKPNQKSPEEENVENDTKEVHMNNSCHEIPLRPSREGSQSSKVPETSNTGNSSWP